jgi:putative ABC transport system permease protein
MYLSALQEPMGAMSVVVRARMSVDAVAPALRVQLRRFDAALPLGTMQPLNRVVWNSIGRPRFNAALFGASGLIALVLAIIGVYGVIAYAVERRTREFGIRRALGAQAIDVLQIVVGQAFSLVVVGIVIGAAGALAFTRVLSSVLYDVTPSDPTIYVTLSALLAAVAVVASYIPSRRALRVDPTEALRSE